MPFKAVFYYSNPLTVFLRTMLDCLRLR